MAGKPALVTRFAPSPSGPLHLGHGFAAIVAHDAARAGAGTFLLRIEDLDAGRARPEFETGIYDDLAWLGLTFDGIVLHQSARMTHYRAALDELSAGGLTYPCFCTRKEIMAEIANVSAAPHAGGPDSRGPVYPGTCRRLSRAQRKERQAAGMPYVLRLDIAKAIARAASIGHWPATFAEVWSMGAPCVIEAKPEVGGDIVLARKDVPASYHLAVVVDDAESGVTAVTRGEDLLSATHIQVLLQRLLGFPTPIYGHHALVRDRAGNRLAKRDKARALSELRTAGWGADRVRAGLPPLPDLARLS